MWPLALLVLIAAAGGGKKKKGGKHSRPVTMDLVLLPPPRPGGLFRIYEGFPQGIVPPGSELINVAVHEGGSTYYDPRRFLQWSALSAQHLPGTPGWNAAREALNDQFFFGVVAGGSFEMYAVGKRAGPQNCCRRVECQRTTVEGGGGQGTITEDEYLTEMGGVPENYARTLGPGWECTCTDRGSDCWTLTTPLQGNWPLADLGN